MEFSKEVAKSAVGLAERINANAILVLTEVGTSFDLVLSHKPNTAIIAATANEDTFQNLVKKTTVSTLDIDFLNIDKRTPAKAYVIKLITRSASQISQIEDAIVLAMNKGLVGERDVIVILNSSLDAEANSIFIYKVSRELIEPTLYDFIREADINREVFEAVLNIGVEIGREGRAGKPIGTAFIIGDSGKVMEKSKQLILNPFEGQSLGERLVTNPEMSETVKELAQLDGAFIITADGFIEAAGRYLSADMGKVNIQRGLGTRHSAVAAMTKATNAVGITVSQSGGIVRIFKSGEIVMSIEPMKRIAMKTENFLGAFK